jgi:pimeloyl-ACP methyl ester carboxylesterase
VIRAGARLARRFGSRGKLERIASPTSFVWGGRDRLVALADAYELSPPIPHARLITFPDAGHASMLEDLERFNALLSEFTPVRTQ